MVMPIEPDDFGAEAAFTLQDADRFYKIITSGDIKFASEPKASSVLTFFFIHRTSGTFDSYIVHKIFEPSGDVRRQVQSKLGIKASEISQQSQQIFDAFSQVLAGAKIIWNELDLSAVTTREEQIRRIKNWGGVGVKKP